MLSVGILKAYFGKASKNLISELKYAHNAPVSYTYQKSAEGNVTQMIETESSGPNINEFTYNCK
ncbi:hypothetical protein D3C80_2064370 [compost metagenome]